MLSLSLFTMIADDGNYRELSKPLRAAIDEVKSFYNHGNERVIVSKGEIVGGRNLKNELEKIKLGLPTSHDSSATALNQLRNARGRYFRTYDQRKLANLHREVLGNEVRGKDTLYVTVTDLEITPPKEWRYILWDYWPTNDAVISLAAMDPNYWRIEDQNRVATIKHRARTACLCVIGLFLGLTGCQNESCFMYSEVESVVRLDQMRYLGEEHNEFKNLVKRGFSVQPNDLEKVQRIIREPRPVYDWSVGD
jgi:predicted Zn-dependent protease